MENTNYIFKYNNEDYKLAKLIVLAICLLLDLIIIAGIIACFSAHRYLDLIIYLVLACITLIMKIISTFFTFEVKLEVEGNNLKLTKIYPIKSYEIINEDCKLLAIEKYNDAVDGSEKYTRLCSKSCAYDIYVVDFKGKKYMVNIDDFMYSLIEVKRDIS